MHITAICPGCGTGYQVSPTLRGQQMRCPLSSCRTIFTVAAPEPPAPPSVPPPPPPVTPRASQRSGSVGDMVPILSAEAAVPDTKVDAPRSQSFHVSEMVPLIQAEAAEPLPPTTAAPPSWQQAPPPRRTQNGEPPRPKPLPPPKRSAPVEQTPALDNLEVVESPPDDDEQVVHAIVVDDEPVVCEENGTVLAPVELPPGQWEPPPVRRGAGAAVVEPATFETTTSHPDEYVAVRSKKLRNRLMIAAMLLGMFFVLGIGGGVAWFVMRDSEDKLFPTGTG